MVGATNFYMAEIYGHGFGTTEATVPDYSDQNALVDDQKAAMQANAANRASSVSILGAVALILCIAVLMGVFA